MVLVLQFDFSLQGNSPAQQFYLQRMARESSNLKLKAQKLKLTVLMTGFMRKQPCYYFIVSDLNKCDEYFC